MIKQRCIILQYFFNTLTKLLRDILLVAIGGAAGSAARYGLTLAVAHVWQKPFPLATLLINLAGCFAIGLLAGFALRDEWIMKSGAWLLLATGLCGGFTTFSTFVLDNARLLEAGLTASTIGYLAASIVGGLLLCRLGLMMAH